MRPYSRISAMLDPIPQTDDQERYEMLSLEDDCLEPDVQFPECLKTNRQFEVNTNIVKRIPDKGLFYMFYNMPFDKQ